MPSLRDLIAEFPVPAELTSDHIMVLLTKAITDPSTLLPREIREIAISAAFHLVSQTPLT